MIEEIVIGYLNEILDIPAFAEFPNETIEEFVLVEKVGSSRDNYIDNATIALQSYASTMLNAARINNKVKKAMDNIIVLNTISKSKLNSDYNYTDTTRQRYRYQAVYDLVYFESGEKV